MEGKVGRKFGTVFWKDRLEGRLERKFVSWEGGKVRLESKVGREGWKGNLQGTIGEEGCKGRLGGKVGREVWNRRFEGKIGRGVWKAASREGWREGLKGRLAGKVFPLDSARDAAGSAGAFRT